MKSRSYLTDYIQLMATSSVKRRGEELYASGAIKEVQYNERSQHWTFNVQGTNLYEVVIHDSGKTIWDVSCTCPYDWGGICKHEVAALLYIHDKRIKTGEIISPQTKPVKKKAKKIKQRTGKDPFLLPDLTKINLKFIEDHYYSIGLLRTMYNYKLTFDAEFLENSIAFYIYDVYENEFVITIYKEKDQFFIKSNQYRKVNEDRLTKHEAFVLLAILESPSPDLLDMYFNNKYEKIKQKVLKDFGLPEDTDFDKYFRFDFHYKYGFKVIKHIDAAGLIPAYKEDVNTYFYNFFQQVTEPEIHLPKIKKKELRLLAFVVDSKVIYDDLAIEIIPIIGKPNKKRDAIIGKIDFFDYQDLNDYQIELNENQKKLIELIDREEYRGENHFKDLKQIMFLLAKEQFVYKREDIYSERILKKDLQPVKVSDQPANLLFSISEDEQFIHARLRIKAGDKLIVPEAEDIEYYVKGIVPDEDIYYFFKNAQAGIFLYQQIDDFYMVKSNKEVFFEKIILPASKQFDVEFTDNVFDYETVELDFSEKQIYLSEEDDYILIKPQVVYGNGKEVLLSYQADILEKHNGKVIVYKRNYELEADFLNQIIDLHPDFAKQASEHVFYLHYEDFMKDMWFFRFFEQMQQADVEVFGFKSLKNFKYSPYRGKITTSIQSGQDWFDVNLDISFGDQKVSLNDIRKAIVNKQNYILLKDNSVGILPKEWLHKLEKYFRNGEIKENKLKISKLRFSIIDELFDKIDDSKILEELANKRRMLMQFKEIEKVKVPKSIKAELRNYQKEGLNWLNFLDKMKWGGILADDMGLGKTLQILAFLQLKKTKKANLIVVPTSLLFNWQNEIQKFAPKLKAYYHYGSDRTKDISIFDQYHIVFVTYGILLRDIELLKDYTFEYMILDESQAIKNPASRRFKAAVLINAKNKLALTGTPIENSTFDLYAQMSFVNPGLFASLKQFRDSYSNPIDKDGDEQVAKELQKIINPFVLRRTKELVAKELPPKVEDVIYCEMETEQRKIYDAYRNKYRNKLLEKIEEEGLGKSKFMVLEALTRLRQICDSPALLKDDEIPLTDSVKIKEIVLHITEKTANHKILIFSQFVEMLSLIKTELIKRNIEFEYLDGKSSTAQREISVNNFQNNDDLRVFLISLKAGGTGLNLTAADYVYIMDPWWNPAVENQAIDRCYRIGQDKHVFAYRMICKNTIEEKIVNLQQKKKKIASDIIQTDESIMKNISINDIKNLFS